MHRSSLLYPLFVLLFQLIYLPVSAQVEINVKLISTATPLAGFFQTYSLRELQPTQVPRAIEQQYGFTAQLSFIQPLISRSSQRFSTQGLGQIYTLQFQDGAIANTYIERLKQSGDFEWVEENRQIGLDKAKSTFSSSHILPPQATQDPPKDDSISQQWYHQYIRTFEAWDISRGSRQVKIGIVDTGLDYTHPEFEGQIAINTQEDLNGNGQFDPWPNTESRNGVNGDFDGIDNDGNGYADDVIGYDFTHQPRSPAGGDYLFADSDPWDDNRHGTLVAGIVAAKADNGWGGAGIAPDCRLVILRAFSGSGVGEDDDISRAIIYAADNGIRVLNFSFGDVYPSIVMQEAIRYAHRKGVVMVSSAGNGTGDELHYPSGFNEVISVSATAADLANDFEFLWPVSSYGLTVDLAAPGSGIFTSVLQDTASNGEITRFGTPSGTSTSAPMVASAAALLFSIRDGLSPQQVRGILTSSTDDVSDEGWDHFTGAGRLNVFRALSVVGASNVQISSPINDGGSAQEQLYIVGTVLDPEFKQYSLAYQLGTEDLNEWIPIIEEQNYQIYNDTLAIWSIADLAEGEYSLQLKLEKTNGSTAEDRIRFIIDRSAPLIQTTIVANTWDNQIRKMLFVFRSSDQAEHVLFYRRKGSTLFQQMTYDRKTRNGEFLLGTDKLSKGEYEYYIQSTNFAGLVAQTPLESFIYEGGSINTSGFDQQNYSLPMGRMLNQTYDFDNDGFKEIVMTEYNDHLAAGRLKFFEYQLGKFKKVDSVEFKPVLLVKDIADTDGDGLQELLCSVNDSTYILEQAAIGEFPKQEIYKNEDNELFAARFADTDGDGEYELILKDFEDYYIYEPNGSGYAEAAKLENRSPANSGSNAPRVLVADFDLDGKMETVYQDFDGDLLIYEHTSANNYTNTFIDTTSIIREEAGSYLVQGDFDGDGQEEFFVALHTSNKRNSDFEYTPLYWWLRIFKATANDRYEVVWEDYLYDIDNRTFNAATAGNLDEDAADELVFSTFPRTYILEYTASKYVYSWFFYGNLTSHHIIADFNENGVNELGLGLGDSTFFYEKNIAYQGPDPVSSLRGTVLGANTSLLEWQAVNNATTYLIYRGSLNPDNSIKTDPILLDSTQNLSYRDGVATFGERYLYILRTKNPSLNPPLGMADIFQTNFSILRPHENVGIDSVKAIGPQQLEIFFDQAVVDRMDDKAYFKLNGRYTANAIISTPKKNRLILSFPQTFQAGANQLAVDPLFTDAERGRIAAGSLNHRFDYEESESEKLILSQWKSVGDKEAILSFNFPLTASALDSSNYELAPFGQVIEVVWASEAEDAVKVTIQDARIGALGYAVSITVTDVCAIHDVCIDNEGNTATFSSNKEDLSEAFVYPNPVRNHAIFDGLRFANLTKQATIKIYTVSGRFVNQIEETDGDGGVQWDMRDERGQRIKPGIYLFHISTEAEGVEDVLKKFSVLE